MTKPRFISTKTFTHSVGLSAAFRQWRAESHCRFIHGYALQVHVKFIELEGLDVRNWVVDFGSLKSFKGVLEDTFDHKTLVAEDDPLMECFDAMQDAGLMQVVKVPNCGCEAFAGMIYEYAEVWLKDNGYDSVAVFEVEVREHESNSAIARNPRYVGG